MQKSKPKMQNVDVTSNKRSMKNNQNPETGHHTITTARRPDNILSSILVRGRSIRSMARSCRRLRRPLPRKDSHFCHFGGGFACVRARVRACVRVCVRVCLRGVRTRVRVWLRACVCACVNSVRAELGTCVRDFCLSHTHKRTHACTHSHI